MKAIDLNLIIAKGKQIVLFNKAKILNENRGAERGELPDKTDAALALEKNIARAIGGDPKHGQDSSLWEGTGRVRTSDRKTGLTKKKKDENK